MKSCGVSSKKASRYKGHDVTIRDARPSNALLCHSIIPSLLAVNFYYWLGYTLSRLLAKIFFQFRNLHPAQPGLGLVIATTLAPVVPMRIFGAHEAWPRGSNKIRLYPITVIVGHPIFFNETDIAVRGKGMYRRLSERVMNEIAKLSI